MPHLRMENQSYCAPCNKEYQKEQRDKKNRELIVLKVMTNLNLSREEAEDRVAHLVTRRGRPPGDKMCPRCEYVRPKQEGQAYCSICGAEYRKERYAHKKERERIKYLEDQVELARLVRLEQGRQLVREMSDEELIAWMDREA